MSRLKNSAVLPNAFSFVYNLITIYVKSGIQQETDG